MGAKCRFIVGLTFMTKLINYMLNKKAWPFVVAFIGILVFVFATTRGSEKSEPAGKYEKILTTVADILEQAHFDPKKLDDNFSKQVFKKFISDIDPDKNIFLKSDYEKLKKYENSVDNEMRTGKIEFVPAVEELFKTRIAEVSGLYKSILSQPFDFTQKETIQTDRDKMNYANTEAERAEVWRKRLKYMALDRYVEALDEREKNKGTKDYVVKADSTLERESREKVVKIWDRTFTRMTKKFGIDEKFNLYVNTIAETMDPHTEFFPPVEKMAFDEQMSGRFFGIGAQLTEQDGVIKIAALITGSPAWKGGEIQPSDVILKVAQGNAEPVDITGFETTDAVRLIRGKKGTEVRLTLKKTDGTIKVVSIIRDEIIQEEAYARSAIIQKENKIGYIYLPDFYADFENPNGAYCARDVANEVKKLKAENVDGIVIDLRFNGGGSLQEVIKMVGLFIEDGPVVQVKDRDGEISVSNDRDKGVLYTGPLAVMINEYSASASEIFAAAIQDYGRGTIIGSQSYGKGTVQRNIGLDKESGYLMPSSDLGTLKVTLQKFYRINGGSTQLEGVKPDVTLPDDYEFTKNKERDNPNALPWDEIAKASYKQAPNAQALRELEKSYQQKIDQNQSFKIIRGNNEWLSKMTDEAASLNINDYRALQQKIKTTVKQNDNLQTLATPLNIAFMQADETRISTMDKEKADRFRGWLKNLKTDLYLDESASVLNAVISNNKTVKK